MRLHLAEIGSRGIFKMLAAYAVASWVAIELISVIAPAFLLPKWTVAAVTTLLVLGAFPVLLFEWRYNITSKGIIRDTSHVPDEVDRFAKRISTLLLLLLLAAISILWTNYFRTQSTRELGSLLEAQGGAPEIGENGLIRSIAVLPFDNLSADDRRPFLADGIAEAILHRLAQNKELLVTARKSSFYFKDKNVTVAEIGRILGVQALLGGTVQIANNRLRVTSQLVRTSDQTHIWSNVYEAPLDDIFQVQDTIAYTVRDLILAEGVSRLGPPDEADYPKLEAYELLLEARSLLQLGTSGSTEKAIRLLRLAIDLAPTYADAQAWLAQALEGKCFALLTNQKKSRSACAVIIDESKKANNMALELDPDNGVAILLRGAWSQQTGSGEAYDEAMRKALKVAPNDPDVLINMASIRAQALEFSSARTLVQRAKLVDPSDYEVFLSYLYLFCGRQTLSKVVESQLVSYPPSAATALTIRAKSARCDKQFVDHITSLVLLFQLDPGPGAALDALRFLASLGHHKALALIGAAHRMLPGSFTYFRPSETDDTVYFEEILDDRLATYRWHSNSEFNHMYFVPITLAIVQMQDRDYSGAEETFSKTLKLWERIFAWKGTRVVLKETLAIYANQAWLKFERGAVEDAEELAKELLATLEAKGLTQWGDTQGLMQHFPLMVLVLNNRQEQALNWLRDAEQDKWLGFQPLLTSPVFKEFRGIPEVTQILSRLVAMRTKALDEVLATGLPEVLDPSLLFTRIEDSSHSTTQE